MKGLASAPPVTVSNTGTSTSIKPFFFRNSLCTSQNLAFLSNSLIFSSLITRSRYLLLNFCSLFFKFLGIGLRDLVKSFTLLESTDISPVLLLLISPLTSMKSARSKRSRFSQLKDSLSLSNQSLFTMICILPD